MDGDDPANKDFAEKYGLDCYPSVVFAAMSGAAVETLNGAEEKDFEDTVAKLAK